VWVLADEIQQLAEFRGETVEEFSARFVRLVGDRYSLIEKPGGDCIFWDKEAGCTVYPARPSAEPGLSGPRTCRSRATGIVCGKSVPARGRVASTL
jgi:hypothetical protein